MDAAPESAVARSIEERLDELERASDERRRELRAMIAEMPAALSRRALVQSAVAELRAAPNKGEIARRGSAKVLRAPAAVVRRVTRRTS